MAFPFGQLPRLGDYLGFLETQGCTWKARVAVGHGGRSYRELVITNAAGQHYVIVNPDPDERMTLHVTGNIKRRLGIEAPYVPPQPGPPSPEDDPTEPQE